MCNPVCVYVQMQDMPPRLAMLIDQVQRSASYQHIYEALSFALAEMSDRAQFYQWRWNKRERDGLVPVGLANVRAGGPFWRFRPDGHLQGIASYGEEAVGGFDEIDEEIDDGPDSGEVEEVNILGVGGGEGLVRWMFQRAER